MSANKTPEVLVITGPTASGKTGFAIELAKRLNGEIINADSVQVYKGFDIGSAKPTEEELSQVRHHLVSEIDPSEEFNAGVFVRRAGKLIQEITSRDGLPIVVGGTGLYVRSLLCGLISVEVPTEGALRELEEKEAELDSLDLSAKDRVLRLHAWLAEVDPVSANDIEKTDTARIRRALLVKLSTGDSLATLQDAHAHSEYNYRAYAIVLMPERELLYRSINRRVKQMIEQGLLDEVRSLLSQYAPNARAFSAIGYKQAVQHLAGKLTQEKAIESIKRDTRRFAKRQMTWWRNQPRRLGWTPVDSLSRNLEEELNADQFYGKVVNEIGQVFDDFSQLPEQGVAYSLLKDFKLA